MAKETNEDYVSMKARFKNLVDDGSHYRIGVIVQRGEISDTVASRLFICTECEVKLEERQARLFDKPVKIKATTCQCPNGISLKKKQISFALVFNEDAVDHDELRAFTNGDGVLHVKRMHEIAPAKRGRKAKDKDGDSAGRGDDPNE